MSQQGAKLALSLALVCLCLVARSHSSIRDNLSRPYYLSHLENDGSTTEVPVRLSVDGITGSFLSETWTSVFLDPETKKCANFWARLNKQLLDFGHKPNDIDVITYLERAHRGFSRLSKRVRENGQVQMADFLAKCANSTDDLLKGRPTPTVMLPPQELATFEDEFGETATRRRRATGLNTHQSNLELCMELERHKMRILQDMLESRKLCDRERNYMYSVLESPTSRINELKDAAHKCNTYYEENKAANENMIRHNKELIAMIKSARHWLTRKGKKIKTKSGHYYKDEL